jgi:hypothetical protein
MHIVALIVSGLYMTLFFIIPEQANVCGIQSILAMTFLTLKIISIVKTRRGGFKPLPAPRLAIERERRLTIAGRVGFLPRADIGLGSMNKWRSLKQRKGLFILLTAFRD